MPKDFIVNIVTMIQVKKVVGENTLRPTNTSQNRYPFWITEKLLQDFFVSVGKIINLRAGYVSIRKNVKKNMVTT